MAKIADLSKHLDVVFINLYVISNHYLLLTSYIINVAKTSCTLTYSLLMQPAK